MYKLWSRLIPGITLGVLFVLSFLIPNIPVLSSPTPQPATLTPQATVMPLSYTIMYALRSNNQYSVFTSLLEMTSLAQTLQGGGPFTVFAPTDAAMARLPDGILARLRADPKLLDLVLRNHIVPEDLSAKQIRDGDMQCDVISTVSSLSGSTLRYGESKGKPAVRILGKVYDGDMGESYITREDMMTNNGRIHAVDALIIPPEAPDWLEPISTLLWTRGVISFGSVTERWRWSVSSRYGFCDMMPDWFKALHQSGSYTLFVPTEDALARLEARIGHPLNEAALSADIFRYHVLDGVALNAANTPLHAARTMRGDTMAVDFVGPRKLRINNLDVNIVDEFHGLNGVIYVIDTVLLPPSYGTGVLPVDDFLQTP